LKEIYIYNYLKTYKTVEKWYNEKDLKIHYASYLMIGKLTVAFIYPFLRLLDTFNLTDTFSGYSRLFFLLIVIVFFTLDYFLIRKRFDKIVKKFDKKSENDIASLRLYDYIIKFIIIALNLILIFWV
tara:strand:+ start:11148 stop:11528 length:381 start_codon:yes stop_codon:yes gene_type:complete